MMFEKTKEKALEEWNKSSRVAEKIAKYTVINKQDKFLLRNCGLLDPLNINHYIANQGYSGLVKALALQPKQVLEMVEKAGLRGRGGAGYYTAAKWRGAIDASSGEKYLICNAHESDSDSQNGKILLENDPHSILEGMLITAYVIGAKYGYIYVREDFKKAIEILRNALQQMTDARILGNNILASNFSFTVELFPAKPDFVYGEETVLIRAIAGQREVAYHRPPYPASIGLNNKPTIINNVETLANVALILHKGDEFFTGYGTKESPGTKIFTVINGTKRTNIIEAPLGTALRQIIADSTEEVITGSQIKAVEIGGPTGSILGPSAFDTPVDFEHLAELGISLCSGVIRIDNKDSCIIDRVKQMVEFSCDASCGACVLCREGLKQMSNILDDISFGKADSKSIDLLVDLGEVIKLGSLCGLGKTAPNAVLTSLKYFRTEYDIHINEKKCVAGICQELSS